MDLNIKNWIYFNYKYNYKVNFDIINIILKIKLLKIWDICFEYISLLYVPLKVSFWILFFLVPLYYVFNTFIILIGGFVIYFIPTVIACLRHRENADLVFVLNLFFNWTIIGWFVALFLACTNIDTSPKVNYEYSNHKEDK